MTVLDRIRIVLVEPSHPGNIGGAARALKNMGMKRLLVVNPKRFPDPQADWRAAGALDVLDHAIVVDTLDEAVADCHWIIGTSTRNRKIPWPISDAKGIAEYVVNSLDAQAQIAVVFGREDNGLSNEELMRCHQHLQIPANEVYSSLNLAMAVQVVAYEIYQQVVGQDDYLDLKKQPSKMHARDVQKWDRPMATAEHVEMMLAHLQQTLVDTDFLDPTNPGQTMTRMRRMFARLQMDETEVQILRGILKHVGLAAGQNAANSEG